MQNQNERTNSINNFQLALKIILLLNKNSHRVNKKANILPKQCHSFDKNSLIVVFFEAVANHSHKSVL